MKRILLLQLALVIFCQIPTASAQRQPPPQYYFSQAQQEFKAENYDQAIVYYRKYLRKNRRDLSAWLQLAASYYHIGLPEKALRYLKRYARGTKQKSYNFYYQGMAYLAINRPQKAVDYFAACARFIDEYGSRCSFEMAIYEYNRKKKAKALYWVNLYLKRYPRGRYARVAHRMGRSLEEGYFIKGLKGSKKPDTTKALFRFHPLSLSDRPHFWFVQGGGELLIGTEKNPTQEGLLEAADFTRYAVVLATGAAIGPLKAGTTEATAGYMYRQHWVTNDDRFAVYFEDPGDIEYQPFRTDLLERRHQFFGDYKKEISETFSFGGFGRIEFARVGSSLIPSPDAGDFDEAQPLAETTTLIPWVAATFAKKYRTSFYLFLRKELNELAPELSNKSFDLSDSFTMSMGVSQLVDLPTEGLRLNFELYRYDFIYNDLWEDYVRLGFLAGIQYEFVTNLFFKFIAGYYQDDYYVDLLKQESCNFKPRRSETPQPVGFPKQCPRDDNGFIIRLGSHWNISRFWRLDFWYTFVQNSNPNLELFDKTINSIEGGITFAFPSPNHVIRYTDRFLDNALTKEGG